jgi:hypothetical protein
MFLFFACVCSHIFLLTAIALTFSREPTMRIIDSVKSSAADAYHTYINPTKPREIVDLMTEFYELLADIGYYERSIINQPPHLNLSINQTLAAELWFSKRAVQMMEMLPYLNMKGEEPFMWQHGAGSNEFFL